MTPRDYALPTTAHHAHLPQWMVPGVTPMDDDAPLCSFVRSGWTLVDGGGGKPLCRWCVKSLRWSRDWLADMLDAALGEDTGQNTSGQPEPVENT